MKTINKEDAAKVEAYRAGIVKYANLSVIADIIAECPAYGELSDLFTRASAK